MHNRCTCTRTGYCYTCLTLTNPNSSSLTIHHLAHTPLQSHMLPSPCSKLHNHLFILLQHQLIPFLDRPQHHLAIIKPHAVTEYLTCQKGYITHLRASSSTSSSPSSIAFTTIWHMQPTMAQVADESAPPDRGSRKPAAPDLHTGTR